MCKQGRGGRDTEDRPKDQPCSFGRGSWLQPSGAWHHAQPEMATGGITPELCPRSHGLPALCTHSPLVTPRAGVCLQMQLAPYLSLHSLRAKNGFYIFNWWGETKRRIIFCDMEMIGVRFQHPEIKFYFRTTTYGLRPPSPQRRTKRLEQGPHG